MTETQSQLEEIGEKIEKEGANSNEVRNELLNNFTNKTKQLSAELNKLFSNLQPQNETEKREFENLKKEANAIINDTAKIHADIQLEQIHEKLQKLQKCKAYFNKAHPQNETQNKPVDLTERLAKSRKLIEEYKIEYPDDLNGIKQLEERQAQYERMNAQMKLINQPREQVLDSIEANVVQSQV